MVEDLSIDDLGAIDTALAEPDLAEAATSGGMAPLRVDEFTQPECVFRFSNRSGLSPVTCHLSPITDRHHRMAQ